MGSLVEELQRDALDQHVRVSDLLRKARTIAHKLNLPELAAWVENELNGYPETATLPDYRSTKGRVKGRNPFHGWQPVIFDDAGIEEAFSKQPIGQKVAELEDVIARSKSGDLMIPLSTQAKQVLMNATGMQVDFAVFVNTGGPIGILDAVRNSLLDWSLKLEQAGIKGDGMSFSNEERKKAHKAPAVYNIGSIGTFTGNMGSGSATVAVEGDIVNVDSKAAILDLIERIRSNETQLGLKPESASALDQTLDGLQMEVEKKRPSDSRVRALLGSIRNIAEGAAGSLVAQGILYELSKLAK